MSEQTNKALFNAYLRIRGSSTFNAVAQADELVRDREELKQERAALPAIREFLDKNLDVNFRGIADTRSVGYDTLRTALIDTMQQIGGPESVSAALQTLQTTADPTEIAMFSTRSFTVTPANDA